MYSSKNRDVALNLVFARNHEVIYVAIITNLMSKKSARQSC